MSDSEDEMQMIEEDEDEEDELQMAEESDEPEAERMPEAQAQRKEHQDALAGERAAVTLLFTRSITTRLS